MDWIKLQERALNEGIGIANRVWSNRDARQSAALYFTHADIAAFCAMAYKAGYDDGELASAQKKEGG